MRTSSRFLAAALGILACFAVFAPIASAADTTAPTQPNFAIATASVANQAPSITLDFGVSTDRGGIREYVIYRNDKVNAVARLMPWVTHRVIDRNLLGGTNYTYVVRAIDWSGNASAPAVATATTFGTAAAFSPFYVRRPDGLSLTAASHSSMVLSIAAPGYKVAKFNLYRNNDVVPFTTISGSTNVDNMGNAVTKFTDTGLVGSTTYTYTVRGVDSEGALGEPMSVSGTTLVAPPVTPKKCTASLFGMCLAWK